MEAFFNEASRMMTVVSMATFLGIVFWAWSARRHADFDHAAALPFADDDTPVETLSKEDRHV